MNKWHILVSQILLSNYHEQETETINYIVLKVIQKSISAIYKSWFNSLF